MAVAEGGAGAQHAHALHELHDAAEALSACIIGGKKKARKKKKGKKGRGYEEDLSDDSSSDVSCTVLPLDSVAPPGLPHSAPRAPQKRA